jgi:hypothetical protein
MSSLNVSGNDLVHVSSYPTVVFPCVTNCMLLLCSSVFLLWWTSPVTRVWLTVVVTKTICTVPFMSLCEWGSVDNQGHWSLPSTLGQSCCLCARQADCKLPGPLLSPAPPCYRSTGNSSPHTCITSTLPSEPTLQLQENILLKKKKIKGETMKPQETWFVTLASSEFEREQSQLSIQWSLPLTIQQGRKNKAYSVSQWFIRNWASGHACKSTSKFKDVPTSFHVI